MKVAASYCSSPRQSLQPEDSLIGMADHQELLNWRLATCLDRQHSTFDPLSADSVEHVALPSNAGHVGVQSRRDSWLLDSILDCLQDHEMLRRGRILLTRS